MANCPNCQISLQTVREIEGLYYRCNQCGGRAETMQQIRRTVGDRYISGMVRRVNTATEISSRACPFCTVPMKLLQLPNPPLTLESCRTCSMIWFDPGKFEQLPEGAVDNPDDAMGRALVAEAEWKMEQQRQDGTIVSGQPPDATWKWIPAFLGLPVKFESAETSCLPWATWSLSAVVALISICAFGDLRHAVENFGMIPAHAWRYGGATLITCFFIHAGIFHLVGNLYFFLLCGGDVEGFLGRRRFLALIFVSTIFGNLLDVVVEPSSHIPLIGASGGISGVMVFYTLQFPRAKLSFLFRIWFRFIWINIPSWFAFIAWLLLQIVGAFQQVAGASDVASLAHLGGVLTGFALWLWWRKLKTDQVEAVE
jgi:membrane associated rhomboid family serine protease